MNDVVERLKDLKTSIPGAIAGVWAIVDLLAESGIQINISQRTAVNLALILVGTGLLLSGGKKKEPPEGEKK